METLLGKTVEELQAVALGVGLQKFAGKQLAEWIYVRRVTSFEQMTNISLKGREALKAQYTIGRYAPVREAVSVDGTRKYLFPVGEQFIEAVYIPEDDRATLCVSTQAGCKMGCRFCMTHARFSRSPHIRRYIESDLRDRSISHHPTPITHHQSCFHGRRRTDG